MSPTNMFSAGLGAAGLGVVFPAMRNGVEVDGLGVGVNDTFFLESDEDPPCSFCKGSCSSGNKTIPGLLVCLEDGLILPGLCHVDFAESSSKVKSNHCSFQRNDFSF